MNAGDGSTILDDGSLLSPVLEDTARRLRHLMSKSLRSRRPRPRPAPRKDGKTITRVGLIGERRAEAPKTHLVQLLGQEDHAIADAGHHQRVRAVVGHQVGPQRTADVQVPHLKAVVALTLTGLWEHDGNRQRAAAKTADRHGVPRHVIAVFDLSDQ
jgi:hypothetical protein